jgi:ankyrin repeat protein
MKLVAFLLGSVLLAGCSAESNSEIFDAISNNDIGDIERLILNSNQLEARNEKGYTPLIESAENGNYEIVSYLLSQGANINARSVSGQTALHRAISWGHKDVAILLLEKGASPVEKESTGETALSLAVRSIPSLVPKMLDIGWDPDVANEGKVTPLMIASLKHDVDVVNQLLTDGANVNAQNIYGATALHYALSDELSEKGMAVLRLLLKNGADIDAQDNKGYTPLIKATISSGTSAMRVLLDAGAEIDRTTELGWTALLYSVDMSYHDKFELLISYNADPFVCGKSNITGSRWCAEDSAKENQDQIVLQRLDELRKKIRKSGQ